MEDENKNPTKQILGELAILMAWFIAWCLFGHQVAQWLGV
jgi:hypothetical protein